MDLPAQALSIPARVDSGVAGNALAPMTIPLDVSPLSFPIYDKVRAYNAAPDNLKSDGLYFYMRKLESSSDAHIVVNGQKMLMFGSNNYLGLTNHPRVKAA